MLNDQRGRPHVILGYGSALATELLVNKGILMRGLLVGIQCSYIRAIKKLMEELLIGPASRPHRKAGPQLSDCDEWHGDEVRTFQLLDYFRHGVRKVGITIGVERSFIS